MACNNGLIDYDLTRCRMECHGAKDVSARKFAVFSGVLAGLALAVAQPALTQSSLHEAARSGNLAEVQQLLDAGADVNLSEQGKTPLHHAALVNPDPGVVQALLDAGARVDLKGHNGMTALHFAVVDPTPMAAMMRTDDEVDAEAETNHTAQRLAVIQLLLDAGATAYAKNEDGLTPLHLAAGHHEDPEVSETLLMAGAFADARAENDSTPLHFAGAFNGNPEVAQVLLDFGAEVDAVDIGGVTPLHLAARFNRHASVAQVLLDAGADVNAKDRKGLTPLDHHAEREDSGWPQTLEDAGGKCNRSC